MSSEQGIAVSILMVLTLSIFIDPSPRRKSAPQPAAHPAAVVPLHRRWYVISEQIIIRILVRCGLSQYTAAVLAVRCTYWVAVGFVIHWLLLLPIGTVIVAAAPRRLAVGYIVLCGMVVAVQSVHIWLPDRVARWLCS